jgi:hypothetical protein
LRLAAAVAVVSAPLALFVGNQVALAGGDLYTPATPVLDGVQGGPWTLSQGDSTAAGYPYPSSDLLPGYTPLSETAPPNLAVYPAASTSSSPYSPYVSGVAGAPGPLPAYCTSSGAFPETGTLNAEPTGVEPMSPYYFPFVMQTPGTTSPDDLTGYFDYRPKDAEEAVVVATSTNEGDTWSAAGQALGENPTSYCPGADTNDNGQGHPYVMAVNGQTYLYTLQRPAGDTVGVGLLLHSVNPAATNPLASLPSTESVGVDPNTYATSSTPPVAVATTGSATIPVTTLGTAGTPEQIFAGQFVDMTPPASASTVITCATLTTSPPSLNGCTSSAPITVQPSDDLAQVIGTVSSGSNGATVPSQSAAYPTGSEPANTNSPLDNTALASLKFTLNANDSATIGALLNANISGRIYVGGTAVYCGSVNGSNTTLSECSSPQGPITLATNEAITTDPIVPATALQTSGLIAPDGIVGTLPQSFNSTLASALSTQQGTTVTVPSTATVIMYGEKILNYYDLGTVTTTTTSGGTTLEVTPSATFSNLVPSATSPVTIYVGVCPSGDTSCTNTTGGTIDALSCTGYTASGGNDTFNGCTGFSSGDVAISGFTVGGPGAAVAPAAVLADTGEGSTNPKTLFKNNEDLTVLRYADTSNGISFTDLGAISGTSSQPASNPAASYTDINNPSAENFPASQDLAIGATDDPELRYVGTRGTIIENPSDGSLTLFDSAAWESDGDSDAFNQIFESTSANGVTWSEPEVVVSTDHTFGARQYQDAQLALGSYTQLPASAYYAGRAYSPTVVQNSDGSLTMVFSGYSTPKPLPADGSVLGDGYDGAPTWTVSPIDPALYRNILTVTLEPGPSSGQVPESPLVVALPIIALLLGAGVLVVTRRPRTAAPS